MDRVVEVHNFMQEHLRGSHLNIRNGLKPLHFKIQILLQGLRNLYKAYKVNQLKRKERGERKKKCDEE